MTLAPVGQTGLPFDRAVNLLVRVYIFILFTKNYKLKLHLHMRFQQKSAFYCVWIEEKCVFWQICFAQLHSLIFKCLQTYFLVINNSKDSTKNCYNRRTHIRHQCRKTTLITCQRCLINTGVEKNEQHLNIDQNFDHQMSLSQSKCWYSNNCLHLLKCAVLLVKCI